MSIIESTKCLEGIGIDRVLTSGKGEFRDSINLYDWKMRINQRFSVMLTKEYISNPTFNRPSPPSLTGC